MALKNPNHWLIFLCGKKKLPLRINRFPQSGCPTWHWHKWIGSVETSWRKRALFCQESLDGSHQGYINGGAWKNNTYSNPFSFFLGFLGERAPVVVKSGRTSWQIPTGWESLWANASWECQGNWLPLLWLPSIEAPNHFQIYQISYSQSKNQYCNISNHPDWIILDGLSPNKIILLHQTSAPSA